MNPHHSIRSRFSRFFLAAMVFTLLQFPLFFSLAVESDSLLRVGVTTNTIPGALDRNEVVPKILMDLLNDIAKHEGWKVEYVEGSVEANRRRLEREEIDLLLPIHPGADSAGSIIYNRESVLSTWGLIYAPSGSGIGSLLDLNGKVVAVASGDTYFLDFEEMVRRFNIEAEFVIVHTYDQVLQAIEKSHVDAGIVERTFGLLNENHYHAVSTPIIFAPAEVHYASRVNGNLKWLDTIDYYLALYKRDQNSIYYETIDTYLGAGDHPLPRWVKVVIWGSILLLVVSVVVLIVQHREVARRREELVRTNRELDDQIQIRMGQEAELLRFGTVVSQMVEGVVITDTTGIVQYVNPAFEELSGEMHTSMKGQPFKRLLHGTDRNTLLSAMNQSLEAGQNWKDQFLYHRADEQNVAVEGTVSAIRNSTGEVVSYLAIIRDVSFEVRLEEQLRQSQKLEAIGTLAGGIAHDFNNTLFAMMGYTDLALTTLPPDDSRREMLKQVLQAGTRAKELIQQILTFSRKSDQSLRVLELQPLVKETLKLIRPTMPASVAIKTELEAAGVLVRSDATQIHQVVMNLSNNAAYAMEKTHGTLSLALHEIEVDATLAQNVSGLKCGRYVRLKVADTGNGISRQIMDRIFEPFFTTKPNGRGTGMGLSVVHGIVMNHGGAISVSSEVGKGTCFDVYFPRVVGSVQAEPSQKLDYPVGHERVMVVDDETVVADTMKRMLSHLGYHVESFIDSVEAWRHFRDFPREYDLLVTDLSMPGMSGIELARECSQARPDLPILMVTGYGQDISGDSLYSLGIRELISKPLLTGDLAIVVRRLLDESSERVRSATLLPAPSQS